MIESGSEGAAQDPPADPLLPEPGRGRLGVQARAWRGQASAANAWRASGPGSNFLNFLNFLNFWMVTRHKNDA